MESMIKSKHVDTLCRICLTTSKTLVHICDPTEKVSNLNGQYPIFDMLERVTFQKVVLSSKFPSKLCQMCLSFLKITYNFQEQFYSSQKLLEKVTEESPVEESELSHEKEEAQPSPSPSQAPASVAVELICGGNKFDLNDVLIVEEENKDNVAYDGFLRNLGTEVTAKFIHKNAPLKSPVVQNGTADGDFAEVINVVVETPPTQNVTPAPKFSVDKIDLSRLTVDKYPETCKVVIRDVDTNTIIKTLYECPVCKSVALTESDLDTHIDCTHLQQNFFICEQCGHMARTKSQLYHHKLKHNGKTYQCDYCDKKYSSISHLKVHLDVHKNERRHLCYHCGKTFNYAVSLKYHLRLHYDKKFVCNFCGLKYRMPNTLKRHLRTHTKDKPYVCEYCPKRFSSRGEQVSHEMVHTGVRPYHCEYCGKGYIKCGNLKEHYLSHPGPHQCNCCAKTFIDMKFLKIHMKRAHSEDEVEDGKIECFM